MRREGITKSMMTLVSTLLRAAAMAIAAMSVVWGVAATEGLVSAMAGAALGVLLGQLLGGSKLKLGVVVAVLAVLGIGTWELGNLALTTESIPRAIGPGATLVFVYAARFAVLAFAVTATSRAVATRYKSLVAVELVLLAFASTVMFASHRDGVLERPLWLSDWSWQVGIAPARVLLAVGLLATLVLAILHLAERKSGRGVSAIAMILGLGILASIMVTVTGGPKPRPLSDVDPIANNSGDPPNPKRDAGDAPHPADQSGNDGGQDGGDGGDGGDAGDAGDGGDDAGDAGDGGDGRDAGDGGDGGRDAKDAGDGGGSEAGADSGMDGGSSPPDAGDGGDSGSPPDAGEDASGPTNLQPSSPDMNSNDNTAPSTAQTPMVVIVFETDYSPPGQSYFFRQEAQSHFTGVKLAPSPRSDADLDVATTYPTLRTKVTEPTPDVGRQRVIMRAAMVVDHPQPVVLEGTRWLDPVQNPNPQRFVRAYRFEAFAQTIPYKQLLGKKVGDPKWSDDLRKYYTEAPEDPRYKQLAEGIVSKLPEQLKKDPVAQAMAIKMWLDKNISYSKKERHAGAQDPTADMLFGNRVGYCVHLAHAAVFMWRSLGIPSRASSGYRAEEDARKGGSSLVLRASDSHQWPEIYIENIGWLPLDVYPQKILDQPPPAPDDDMQKLLGEMARQKPEEQKPKPIQKIIQQTENTLKKLAVVGSWAALTLLLLLYAVKLWRQLAPFTAGRKSIARVGYRAALDALAEVGISREHGETREQFASRVAKYSPTFVTLTDLHLAATMRDPKLDANAREELSPTKWRESLHTVVREVVDQMPWHKRLFGAANPFSFLRTR